MRISDWSSDVCSSDLPACPERDLKRKRHRREAVTEEDKVRRAAPHVGSARRRHRDVGGRKRRRVVEPVPHHQHLAAFCGERSKPCRLVARPNARAEARDAKPVRNGLAWPGVVAGQDLDGKASTTQRPEERRGGEEVSSTGKT